MFKPGNHGSSYKKLEKLGEGTYGVVYKACNTETGEFVAIKKIKLDHSDEGLPATTLREISMLKQLTHPCIVDLIHANYEEDRLYLIFEYVEQDMKAYMDSLSKAPSEKTIKKFMYQLLSGLYHCHKHRILHRDLKPQNLLIGENDTLKLADFGLGREHGIPIEQLTHEVVTLWYRAPEILLGTKKYSGSVDMWSVGCIFAEFYKKEALFMGDCEIDQMFQIFKVLGTADEESWAGVSNLADYQSIFPRWRRQPLQNVVNTISKNGLDLLEKCLVYRPGDRIYAKQALNHPYFDRHLKAEFQDIFAGRASEISVGIHC